MGHGVIARHQVGYGEALLVDPVQGKEKAGQCKVLVDKSFRLPTLSETVIIGIEGRYGLIPMPGTAVHDDARGKGIIEVPSHQDRPLRRTGYQRGTSISDRIGLRFRERVESFGQEPHRIGRQFTGSTASALFHQFVKTVISLVFHIVKPFIEFPDGHRPFHERSEHQPSAQKGYGQNCQKDP